MALVECPECKAAVSTAADACPKCGFPIGKEGDIRTGSAKTQLVEGTAKRYKFMMLLASLACIAGVILVGIGMSGERQPESTVLIGVLCLVIGLPIFILARVLAWWKHG